MKSFSKVRSELLCILILSVVLLFSCHSGNNHHAVVRRPGKEDLAELNRYLVQKDREIIESYAARKELKMTESPTGLWYLINKQGKGSLLKENDKVQMTYQCDLLDGTKCYSSDDSGPKEVVIGKSRIEQGLDEGLRLLKPGAESRCDYRYEF